MPVLAATIVACLSRGEDFPSNREQRCERDVAHRGRHAEHCAGLRLDRAQLSCPQPIFTASMILRAAERLPRFGQRHTAAVAIQKVTPNFSSVHELGGSGRTIFRQPRRTHIEASHYSISVASGYTHYVSKAEKRDTPKQRCMNHLLADGIQPRDVRRSPSEERTLRGLLRASARMNPSRSLITGVICGGHRRHLGRSHHAGKFATSTN